MQSLLVQLLEERGAIRLAVDLALALGSLAVLAAWGMETVRARRRRQATAGETAERRRAAA